jgi:hypothetical protein
VPERNSSVRSLLRVPLFSKILIANAAIVVAGVLTVGLPAFPGPWSGWPAELLFVGAVGVLGSIAVNARTRAGFGPTS